MPRPQPRHRPVANGKAPAGYTRVAVVSNCQTFGLTSACESAGVHVVADSWDVNTTMLTDPNALSRLSDSYDVLFIAPFARSLIESRSLSAQVFDVPPLIFEGYHPDLIQVGDGQSARGGQSAIVLAAFLRGIDAATVKRLFNADVFRMAGYFDAWQPARERLLKEFAAAGLDLVDAFYRWTRNGPFMNTALHPKIWALQDLAIAALRKAGIDTAPPVELADNLVNAGVYPIYPEIGRRLGVPGDYRFRGAGSSLPVGLEEFIDRSFAAYAEIGESLSIYQAHADKVAHTDAAIASYLS